MQLAAAAPVRADRPRYPLAVHLVLRRDDSILLLRHHNTGYRDGHYALPAGMVEDGESALAAMIRETREETGLVLASAHLQKALTMHRFARDGHGAGIDFFFLAEGVAGEPMNAEPEKCDALGFFPMGALPNPLVPYHAAALAAIVRGERYTEFGWTG